jgi:hypothetical protein
LNPKWMSDRNKVRTYAGLERPKLAICASTLPMSGRKARAAACRFHDSDENFFLLLNGL